MVTARVWVRLLESVVLFDPGVLVEFPRRDFASACSRKPEPLNLILDITLELLLNRKS